jgi:hypothetical protein
MDGTQAVKDSIERARRAGKKELRIHLVSCQDNVIDNMTQVFKLDADIEAKNIEIGMAGSKETREQIDLEIDQMSDRRETLMMALADYVFQARRSLKLAGVGVGVAVKESLDCLFLALDNMYAVLSIVTGHEGEKPVDDNRPEEVRALLDVMHAGYSF